MKRILIISRRSEVVKDLHDNLVRVQVQGRAAVIRDYPSPEQLASLLHSAPAQTVLVDLEEPEKAVAVIAAVHARHPEVVTLAVHTVNSPDLILSAIRAGAAEYIGPPFKPEELERALQKQSNHAPKPRGRVIAFLPAVGGSGASTAALHVAGSIVRHARKGALLVDLDFHSSSLNLRLRLQPRFTLADAFDRIDCLDELWDQLASDWEGIKIVAAPEADATPSLDYGQMPVVFDVASQRYEWVIADLPPALYSSCQDVLRCCDAVYIVCTTELASLHHARQKAQQLGRIGLRPEVAHLLVNRLDASFKPADIEGIVGMRVEFTLRNDYAGVNNAYRKGHLMPDNSMLSRQLRQFTQHVMGVKPQGPAPGPAPARWKRALAAPRALVAACPTI